MAHKPLTAMLNPSMVNNNNSNAQELSVKMPITSIELSPSFQEIFPLDDEAVKKLSQSISDNGYDKSQPVHIWTTNEKNLLIDGHTRLAAAKQAGLYDIPVFKHSFETERDAILYVYRLQLDRRNLDDAAKLIAIEQLDQLKNPGRKIDNGKPVESGKSAVELAKQLNMSPRQVEKIRSVLKNSDEETLQKIKDKKITINKAYSEKHPIKKTTTSKEDSEIIATTTDTIHSLSFNHSDGLERPDYSGEDSENTADKSILEKRESYLSGKSDGFILGIKFTLAKIENGLSVDEIFQDINNRVFSPKIMETFSLTKEEQEKIDSLTKNKKNEADEFIDTGDFLG